MVCISEWGDMAKERGGEKDEQERKVEGRLAHKRGGGLFVCSDVKIKDEKF